MKKFKRFLLLAIFILQCTACTQIPKVQADLSVQNGYILTPNGNLFCYANDRIQILSTVNDQGPFSDLHVTGDPVVKIRSVHVKRAETETWIPLPEFTVWEQYRTIPDDLGSDEMVLFRIPSGYRDHANKYTLFWISEEQRTQDPFGTTTVTGTVEAVFRGNYKTPYQEAKIDTYIGDLDLSDCKNEDEKIRAIFERTEGNLYLCTGKSQGEYTMLLPKSPFRFTEESFTPDNEAPFVLHEDGTVTTTLPEFAAVASLQGIEKIFYEGSMLFGLDTENRLHPVFAEGHIINGIDTEALQQLTDVTDLVFLAHHMPIFLHTDGTLSHCQTNDITFEFPQETFHAIETDAMIPQSLLYAWTGNDSVKIYSYYAEQTPNGLLYKFTEQNSFCDAET